MADQPQSKPAARTPPNDPDKALMTLQRRDRIIEIVQSAGSVRVSELSDRFGISEVTIRNDLVVLEREERLVRDRGGAISKESRYFVSSLPRMDERAQLHLDVKRRVAQAAAARVQPGDTILLDAGTTIVEMAPHLVSRAPLTVVTNGINVMLELSRQKDIRLICLGGSFHPESGSMVGPLAEEALAKLTIQKLFLGTQALDLEHGLTDSTMEIAQVKWAMIRAARQVILVTDASKWDHAGFIKVAPLTGIDTLVIDDALPAAARPAIEQLGIELVIV